MTDTQNKRREALQSWLDAGGEEAFDTPASAWIGGYLAALQSIEFLTVQEVARICDVTRATVYNWMRFNGLESQLAGGRRLIRRGDLLRFMSESGD